MALSEGRGLKTPGREDMRSNSTLGGSHWLPGREGQARVRGQDLPRPGPPGGTVAI